jgi:hypothetical protein
VAISRRSIDHGRKARPSRSSLVKKRYGHNTSKDHGATELAAATYASNLFGA